MSPVIHLVRREGGGVRPVCGQFAESRNWTTVRRVATCPECLGRGEDPTAAIAAANGPAEQETEREPA